MIQIKRLVFNPFQENTYLLFNDNSEAFIIDAGCYHQHEKDQLIQTIEQMQLSVKAVVATHGHVDHALGNAFVCSTLNVPLWMHKQDVPLLEKAPQMGQVYGFEMEVSPKPEKFLAHGDVIHLGDDSLQVMHIPGHSPGSIVLYTASEKFVVAGDVLFQGSIGRSDLPGGNQHELIDGIRTHLLTLPDDTVVYPGHGAETNIGFERRQNPFLRP